MKKITILLLSSLFFLSCNNSSTEDLSEIKETPHDFMFMQRAYPTGELKTDAYSEAIQWKKQEAKQNSAAIWEFAGPENVGGTNYRY